MRLTLCETRADKYPLSLRIPALLIRIVTVPNESMAVLMTAAPSETEDMFTTAFPPAIEECIQHLNPPIYLPGRVPFVISSTTFCAAAPLKSFTTTLAPRDANRSE